MAVRHGYGKVAGTDALVFAYDTGDTVNSYKGEPTTNLIPNIGTSTANWTEHGWSGDFVTSSDYPNTFELTATNGWHNGKYDFGVSSGGTIYVKFDYKIKSHQTNQYNMFVLNGTHLGSYTTYIAAGTQAWEWQTFTGSFTANADTNLAIGIRGQDSSGLTDVLYIRNLQVEQKSHPTPFVNGTRSVSGSLLDLTGNSSINLTNMSFDSNAQMTFDGTSDYINFPAGTMPNFGTDDFAIEVVFKMTKSTSYSHFYQVKDQYYFALKMSNGDQRIYVYRTSALSTYSSIAADTTLGAWHHLVCQRNGDNIEMYLNGEYKGSKSGWGSIDIDGDTYDTIIGRYNNEYSQGDQPVTKVYNRALTAGEVKNNYSHYKNRFNI